MMATCRESAQPARSFAVSAGNTSPSAPPASAYLTPSVLQWTGVSPWMDLVQRSADVGGARPDVYVNFYYGFAFADAVDAACASSHDQRQSELADHIADAWRARLAYAR